jgi:hypothetical protein
LFGRIGNKRKESYSLSLLLVDCVKGKRKDREACIYKITKIPPENGDKTKRQFKIRERKIKSNLQT